jgi:hypothetical protein
MAMKEILERYKSIAVVGCSTNPEKPAHYVPKYLQEKGYKIIPVNPFANEILGEKAYPSLLEVKDGFEIVQIFRPSEETPEIARQAVKKGAKVIWMQEGIKSEEAAKLARKAGLEVIMDKCMLKEHKRLFG